MGYFFKLCDCQLAIDTLQQDRENRYNCTNVDNHSNA